MECEFIVSKYVSSVYQPKITVQLETEKESCESRHFHTINYSVTHLCKHLSTVSQNKLEKL